MLLKQNPVQGEPSPSGSYDQFLLYLYPGLRYRLSDRISLLGRARWLLLSAGDSPYRPQRTMGISVTCEMPLLFRDTNTETLRSLIFLDRKRRSFHASAKARTNAPQGRLATFLPSDSLNAGDARQRSDDYFKQREELQKNRKQALEDMKKIEEMLE